MDVLIACEFSQVVQNAFMELGHNAWSCDIDPCEEPNPDYHIEGDMFEAFDLYHWDLVIAHPPCTALCVSGNRWYSGTKDRTDAVKFVEAIWELEIDKLVIENPVGVLNTFSKILPRPYYRQPWHFGHKETKNTGFWSRGLPQLQPTNIVGPPPQIMSKEEKKTWNRTHRMSPSDRRGKDRSITFEGIALAMADQWGNE